MDTLMNRMKLGLDAVLAWFVKEPKRLRSLHSIDNRCLNLTFSAGKSPELYHAREQYFLPLLRTGVVEFYGNNLFGLGPTCAIVGSGQLLLINTPTNVNKDWQSEGEDITPGIKRLKWRTELSAELRSRGIPCYKFQLKQAMTQLKTPEAVIRSWQAVSPEINSRFEFYKHGWQPVPSDKPSGIYRSTPNGFAQRYYKLNNDMWFIIPDTKSNFDALNIALLNAKVQHSEPIGWSYLQEKGLLTIREKRFPIIPERLLTIHTLLNGSVNNILNREYYVNDSIKLLLNNYTSNRHRNVK